MRYVLAAATLFFIALLPSPLHAADVPAPGLSDVADYERLLLTPRTERRGVNGEKPMSWKDEAVGHVIAWREFINRYPQSVLVPSAYLRMAEWYLTIKKTDSRTDWYEKDQDQDPNATKDNPELLDPVYAGEAFKLLTKAIREYKDYPHYSHLGGGEFAWNDKVVAVALYERAMFFRGYCGKDLARLVAEFPNLPSTAGAIRDLAKSKSCGYQPQP